jgi:hypothetical protein
MDGELSSRIRGTGLSLHGLLRDEGKVRHSLLRACAWICDRHLRLTSISPRDLLARVRARPYGGHRTRERPSVQMNAHYAYRRLTAGLHIAPAPSTSSNYWRSFVSLGTNHGCSC